MEPSNGLNNVAAERPPENRRHRKEDGWARALRYLVNATYVLLLINLLIFVGIASAQYSQQNKAQIASAAEQGQDASAASIVQNPLPAEQAPPDPAARSDYFKVYFPVLGVGLAVGVAGMLIHRKRTRRRSDRNYRGQLLCIVLSVVGLLLYFVFP